MIIAGALWNLGYNNPSNQDAIREAGGVRLLVELLHTGVTWKAMPNVLPTLSTLFCMPSFSSLPCPLRLSVPSATCLRIRSLTKMPFARRVASSA